MSNKRISLRLNLDNYSHRLAYEIYQSIPKSQKSEFIRLAIILMHDRDEQLKRIKELLSLQEVKAVKEEPIIEPEIQEESINVPDGILDFISDLQSEK